MYFSNCAIWHALYTLYPVLMILFPPFFVTFYIMCFILSIDISQYFIIMW